MIPRGIRNNNPGNLNFAHQPGAHLETGVPEPRFAAFPTMADGIQALQAQLLRYAARGLNTVARIISVYAPSTENETSAYITNLCRYMGVQPDTVLDLNNPVTMTALIFGITTIENGPGYITDSEITDALR